MHGCGTTNMFVVKKIQSKNIEKNRKEKLVNDPWMKFWTSAVLGTNVHMKLLSCQARQLDDLCFSLLHKPVDFGQHVSNTFMRTIVVRSQPASCIIVPIIAQLESHKSFTWSG